MSEGKKYYCYCDSNCKYETLTKEQILAAIQQAVQGQQIIDPDGGVISKVKELHTGDHVTFWVGSRAEYNALQGNVERNCIYIINDDTSADDLDKKMKELEEKVEAAQGACGTNNACSFDPQLTIAAPGGTMTECSIMCKHYTFIQTGGTSDLGERGMVYFTVVVDFKGTKVRDAVMQIVHNGGYLPMSCLHQIPCNVMYFDNYSPFVQWVGQLAAYYRGPTLCVSNEADIVTSESGGRLLISGHYETYGAKRYEGM